MAEKIVNVQKSITGQKGGDVGSSGRQQYEASTNIQRDLNEVKTTRMYVEKNDGTNISGIIIPHDTQIGLSDPNFTSNLGVKGRLKVDSDLIVDGEILGTHHTLEDGVTDAFAPLDSRYVRVQLSQSVIGQVNIGLNLHNSPTDGHVLSFDATNNKLKFIAASGGGGGGSSKHVEVAQVGFNKNATRTLSFDRQTSLGASAFANVKGFMFAPFDGQITKITIFAKGAISTTTHGANSNIKIYVNANNFGSADHTSTFEGDDFTQVNAANPQIWKYSATPNLSVSAGDLIQIQVTRDASGSNSATDAIVQVEITES